MKQEDIRTIIQAGTRAPSGDNTQPWQIRVENNSLFLFNVSKRDMSLYNTKQYASCFALGAFVENSVITAHALGYDTKITLFPDSHNQEHVATIVFVRTKNSTQEQLYKVIAKRATNRNLYNKTPLTDEEKCVLTRVPRTMHFGELLLIEEEEVKRKLASALSVNERLIFENPDLHSFLFKHIRWNEKEVRSTGDGFSIKTFALPPPLEFAFRFFKHWWFLSFLNIFRFARTIPKQTGKMYASSPALGILLAPHSSRENFFNAGMVMERIWLEATQMGLSIQPIMGIVLLKELLKSKEKNSFTKEEKALITSSYNLLESTLGIQGKTILFFFRIGKSKKLPYPTVRLPIERITRTCL